MSVRKPKKQKPETYLSEIKNVHRPQLRGISFNFNMKVKSKLLKTESISVIDDSDEDSRTATEDTAETEDTVPSESECKRADSKECDNPAIVDNNVVPNKLYKVIVVDGEIKLAELDDQENVDCNETPKEDPLRIDNLEDTDTNNHNKLGNEVLVNDNQNVTPVKKVPHVSTPNNKNKTTVSFVPKKKIINILKKKDNQNSKKTDIQNSKKTASCEVQKPKHPSIIYLPTNTITTSTDKNPPKVSTPTILNELIDPLDTDTNPPKRKTVVYKLKKIKKSDFKMSDVIIPLKNIKSVITKETELINSPEFKLAPKTIVYPPSKKITLDSDNAERVKPPKCKSIRKAIIHLAQKKSPDIENPEVMEPIKSISKVDTYPPPKIITPDSNNDEGVELQENNFESDDKIHSTSKTKMEDDVQGSKSTSNKNLTDLSSAANENVSKMKTFKLNNDSTSKQSVKEGKVLLPLSKYTDMIKNIKQLQATLTNTTSDMTLLTSTLAKMEEDKSNSRIDQSELIKLRMFKSKMSEIFTEAQMNKLMRRKNVQWTDKDIEEAVYLYMISHKAYVHVKKTMRFPLPSLYIIKKWMIQKNISFDKAKRKSKQNAVDSAANTTDVETAQSQNEDTDLALNEAAHDPSVSTAQPLNANCSAEIQCGNTETARAVNTLINSTQAQDIDVGNTVEIQDAVGGGSYADNGEQYFGYIDGDDDGYVHDTDIEHDINHEHDVNAAPVDDIVPQLNVQYAPRVRISMKLRCYLCLQPFTNQEEVRQHVAMHYYNTYCTSYLDLKSPFTCEFCNEVMPYRGTLVKHHRAHLGINPFKCWVPGCGFVAKTKIGLRYHQVSHRPRVLQCAQCPAQFATGALLRKHGARVHAQRALHTCALCHATLRTTFTYERHMKSHTRPPIVKCKEAGCTERFYSRYARGQHVKHAHLREQRAHQCPLCPHAAYKTVRLLKLHLHRHKTHRVSKCRDCHQTFYDYGDFYTHCVTQKHDKYVKCACEQLFTSYRQYKRHSVLCPIDIKQREENNGKTRKRKRNENVDDVTAKGDKPKRRKRSVLLTPELFERHIIVADKTYSRNKGTTDDQNKCKDNANALSTNQQQYSEQEQQESVGVSTTPQENITAVLTTQQQNVIAVPTTPQENITAVPTTQQQNVIAVPITTEENITAVPTTQQKNVIAVPTTPQENITAVPTTQQQNVIPVPITTQENITAVPTTQQQNVIAVPTTPQENITAVPTTPQENINAVPTTQQQNVIAVPTTLQKKLIPMLTPQGNIIAVPTTQQNVISVPTTRQQNLIPMLTPQGNIIAVPTTTQQNVTAVPTKRQKKGIAVPTAIKHNTLAVPTTQQKIIADPTNYRFKLSPMGGSIVPLEGDFQHKIIAGTTGNYVKKVKPIQFNKNMLNKTLISPQHVNLKEVVVPEANKPQKVIAIPEGCKINNVLETNKQMACKTKLSLVLERKIITINKTKLQGKKMSGKTSKKKTNQDNTIAATKYEAITNKCQVLPAPDLQNEKQQQTKTHAEEYEQYVREMTEEYDLRESMHEEHGVAQPDMPLIDSLDTTHSQQKAVNEKQSDRLTAHTSRSDQLVVLSDTTSPTVLAGKSVNIIRTVRMVPSSISKFNKYEDKSK